MRKMGLSSIRRILLGNDRLCKLSLDIFEVKLVSEILNEDEARFVGRLIVRR